MFNINNAYENAYMEAKLQEEYIGSRLDKMKEIDIFEATPEEILNMKYSIPFEDMYICNKCKHIFSKDELDVDTITITGTEPHYAGFDNYYDEPYSYDEEEIRCPYCKNKDIYTLYSDDLDDTIKNVDDFIDGFTTYFKQWEKTQESKHIVKEEKADKKLKDSDRPEKDDNDYTKLKEDVKKEMYKYLKSNGIDVEHLRKAGVELNSMKPVIDKMLDTYVATSIADYENEFNIGLAWDYKIENNDIIISIENM